MTETLRTTTEGASCTFALDGVDPETLGLFFGGPLPPTEEPRYSIAFDHTEVVSGAPKRPAHREGLWAWITRANVKPLREWRSETAAWIEAGRPDREVLFRTYIPRARVVFDD